MNNTELHKLIDDFLLLDKEVSKLEYESSTPGNNEGLNAFLLILLEKSKKAYELREKILNYMSCHEIHVTQNSRLEALKKIRDGFDFYSIKVYNNLVLLLNLETEDEKLQYLIDKGLGEFSIYHDFADYYMKKISIGTLIIDREIRDDIKTIFYELKDAFSLNLDYACAGLCRSILEIIIFEKIKHLSDYKSQKKNAVNINCFNRTLETMINDAKNNGFINNNQKKNANDIRKKCNQFIHLKHNKIKDVNINIRGLIKQLMEWVESIYSIPRI